MGLTVLRGDATIARFRVGLLAVGQVGVGSATLYVDTVLGFGSLLGRELVLLLRFVMSSVLAVSFIFRCLPLVASNNIFSLLNPLSEQCLLHADIALFLLCHCHCHLLSKESILLSNDIKLNLIVLLEVVYLIS